MSTTELRVGMRVRHIFSGWAGKVVAVRRFPAPIKVTVRPDHPRPREVFDEATQAFVPTPPTWKGWKPIVVEPGELEPCRCNTGGQRA